MPVSIRGVHGEIIQNSRGNDTIAVTVETTEGTGSFGVPEGASTGEHEVRTVSASEAVRLIEERIAPALAGRSIEDQTAIDSLLHELDGTDSFANLGGNTALGVSIALCKAAAHSNGVEVWQYVRQMFNTPPQARSPRLFVNLINGGKHASQGSPFQEHQIIPNTDSAAEAYALACVIQAQLAKHLQDTLPASSIGFGDEGGVTFPVSSVFEPFEYLESAVTAVASSVAVDIGADIAATSFFDRDGYLLNGQKMDSASFAALLSELQRRVPTLRMIEDPFAEHRMDEFAQYRAEHPDTLIIGDDLTTTNIALLNEAIAKHAIDALIIKPNQIGTLSDTFTAMERAYNAGVQCIVSHRSGETMDDFIADLAYGTGAFGLKAGAPLAPVRDVKYKRLIAIQQSQHE